MQMKRLYGIAACALLMMIFNSIMSFVSQPYKTRLSEYGLFMGDIRKQVPAPGVLLYALNAPLFSDYTQKLRFVQLPVTSTVSYNPDSVFQFPVGTRIAKTFFYYNDERSPSKGRRLVETRILLHEEKGWKALPYVWNEDQSDAFLELAGINSRVQYINHSGDKIAFDYQVPNMNQCKSCHERNGVLTPIGPSARQLNGGLDYEGKTMNQLMKWNEAGVLSGLPEDKTSIPKMVDYSDPSKSLNERALAYLDANCAHCHNLAGQAQTSGLFLDWFTKDKTAFGFYKTPIAAGRGSGGLNFDIVPGKPSESILLFRMASTDPGIMMPELGRKFKHTEGLQLIEEWIKSMKAEK
ncbi:MAG: hypothetical protein RI965_1255 [Bacteroidota bacterium]|jgi:uncharacterized repeat protein (TIGR03806 family)|nr:hypothetical protein [Chitinophagia bacterium]